MYDERKKEEMPDDFLDDLLDNHDDYMGACASTCDCTGLIPSGQMSQAQLLSYKDVYSFPSAAVVDEYKFDGKTHQ